MGKAGCDAFGISPKQQLRNERYGIRQGKQTLCVMCCCSTGAWPLGSMSVGCATRYPLSSMMKHLPPKTQRETPVRPPWASGEQGE